MQGSLDDRPRILIGHGVKTPAPASCRWVLEFAAIE